MDIYLNEEGAKGVTDKVSATAEKLEEVAREITRLIEADLPDQWQSRRATEVQNKYTEQYKSFLNDKVPEMVRELNNYMKNGVQKLIDADSGGCP